ncbi:DMT family transporter [Halodesulfovibrio marinisediminis]|uniref:Permease of the drug/metabolite transporter (DMT) superfamily n=1 Tax=Halodesulfovibrio marinisediminis DSM 17456 TaxID=1121457 RepID=A0A1N6IJK1_9BACT|nr:EamA family transporter [Halodesulfovibrio marinisediminis]SIO32153.1 Permease of the drug/metabolite transporter (DMT) superfamily [Halodesulfovibrio marinisediminis DSM 17456]
MDRYIEYLQIIAAATLWGLLGPISKYGLQEGVTPHELAFWRASLGAVFFILHSAKHKTLAVKPADIPIFLLFGVLGISLFFGSYQIAIKHAGAAVSAILLYTAPIWVAIFARILFKEELSPTKLIALGIALTGTGLVCFSGQSEDVSLPLTGIFFGLLSGFTYSLHYIFGKTFLKNYQPATLYAWCLPAGALCLLPWVTFTAYSPIKLAVVIALAFLCTYLAYYAYCASLRRLEATQAAIIANIEPVIAAGLAVLWWNEKLTASAYIGGALVISAVIIIARTPSKKKKAVPINTGN